jgi:hypothetical protein
MGHRALIAYERPDASYTVHYSHWGGQHLRLTRTISEETPFAADQPSQWSQAIYDHLQHANEPTVPRVADHPRPETAVDPEPWAVGISFQNAVTNHLNFLTHEAFYVVDQSFNVTAYRTLWLGFSDHADAVDQSPTVGHGALRTLRWYDGEPVGDGYLRGWFDGAKTVTATFIDQGLFSESQAISVLLDHLQAATEPDLELLVFRRDR